jgi:hypothetical protein
LTAVLFGLKISPLEFGGWSGSERSAGELG